MVHILLAGSGKAGSGVQNTSLMAGFSMHPMRHIAIGAYASILWDKSERFYSLFPWAWHFLLSARLHSAITLLLATVAMAR